MSDKKVNCNYPNCNRLVGIYSKTKLCMSCVKIGKKRSKESIKKQIKTRVIKYGRNQPGCFKKGERINPQTEFKKGHIPFNKNKPHLQKEKHPMWKGGITPLTRILRNSKRYQEWRNKCFKRDKYTCQICNIIGTQLHVHHIKRWSEYPKLRFNIDNGKTLCKPCHIEEHKNG